MRISRTTTTALAACCSLVLAVAGPALAVDPAPERPAAEGVSASDTADRLTTVGSLGDILSLGARIGKELQAPKPDLTKLREMQRQLTEQAARLRASVKAHVQPGRPGAAQRDLVADVQKVVDQLVKDLNQALMDLAAANVLGLAADVTKILGDLQQLLGVVLQALGAPAAAPAP
ncbi:hypothetical protein J7W19_02860 [Streptomyces mobaraensis NBRC 13819 = DSM 40847]|uniref:Uncharacterized protein n=2 Tax=Streptomyces mobaraensis TaxID=35621 RepID=A0A5N5W4F6_STRMB|nr:hypothetical protein [Streptomyces mobaraensis]EMF00132.1 hypothetical protein H340_12642 [Streptomyces mobaraensis NBRC 13819 = DSM 40847]KAB7839953.1 hypothetical protein FRZ00_20765 [Streptomyces mobaraensis]QTT72517.1 hypothetical protein J7W19_02860 [Streptomyces mobaraensis NBRC 13819 = DSM 40847]